MSPPLQYELSALAYTARSLVAKKKRFISKRFIYLLKPPIASGTNTLAYLAHL